MERLSLTHARCPKARGALSSYPQTTSMAQSHVDEAIDLEAEQSEPSTSTHGSSASTKGKSKAGRPAGKSWEGFLKVGLQ